MTIKFNPEARYSEIHGISSQFPGAKYQQGAYIFNAHRQCLNADDETIVVKSTVEIATDALRKKTAMKADKAMSKLQAAKAAVGVENTPANKAAYTKAINEYEKAQKLLDELSS